MGAAAVNFNSGNGRGLLHDVAGELGNLCLDCGAVNGCSASAPRVFSLGVIGCGGGAQANGGVIGLSGGNHVGQELGATLHAKDKHAGGHGVEGAGVAYLLCVKAPA